MSKAKIDGKVTVVMGQSVVESIISDIFCMITLLGILAVNYYYLGNSLLITCFAIILFFAVSASLCRIKTEHFKTPEEAILWLSQFVLDQGSKEDKKGK